jgi:FAD-dependent urate hydroxylase
MERHGKGRVTVVGAGIGGPVVAMYLKRAGFHVELVEARASEADGEGAFLGVAPNGMSALEPLGLAELVAARGHAVSAFELTNGAGKLLGRIDRSADAERLGHSLMMVRRGELHVLLARAARERGVSLSYGKQLVELESSRAGVAAHFADGTALSSDVLIGCDGLRSTVRKLALPRAPSPRFTGLFDYGGFVAAGAAPVPPGITRFVFGRRAFFGAFTTPQGELWWFHNGAGEERELAARAAGDARERLLERHAGDAGWIGDLIRATPQILGPWPIHELPQVRSWHEGRVCLMGDAAHAMSPSAGQGASLAFEDALVLARCLRDIAEPEAAFTSYHEQRRARVHAIFKEARRNGSGKALESRFSEWLRDRLMPLFLRLGAASQAKHYAYRLSWE